MLPRLIAVLGYTVALLGFTPLFSHLPLLPRLVFIIGLCVGLLAERRIVPLVPHRLLTVISTLLFLWYAAQFSRHNPAVPVVSILVVLLGTRLAAEKSPRTWLQTHALALFALSSSSLFDLGPRFLLFLGLMLPMIALSLVLTTFQARGVTISLGRIGLRQAVLAGLLIPLSALILIPLFFPILPRTQFPLWNFIQQAGGTQPAGLSDTVTPGTTSQVPENGLLAFRAEMPRVSPQQLYWRGPTFSRLDGLQWQRDGYGLPADARLNGSRVNQIITLEPGSSRLLIGLDAPASFSHQNGSLIPNATWNRPQPSSRRLRYEVNSAAGGLIRTVPPSRRLLTQLPNETPPRLRQLALQLRKPGSTDRQRLETVEQYFRNGNFSYSRTNLPTGTNALEQFLFKSRSGHCEFFASGFALLARAAGLPTRLVGGYYGGDYSDLGGYYRVTEDRAHVWVEVWLEQEGWLRIDPSSLAVNADTAFGESRQRSIGLRIRLLLDSMDHTWNSAVITYDFERQLQIASRTHSRLQGFAIRDTRVIALPLGLLLAIAALAWLCLRLRRHGFFNREARLLRRFRRSMEKQFAIPRTSPMGLFDIAEQTGNSQVRAFVERYAGAVYNDRRLSDDEYRFLSTMLRSGFQR